MRVRKNALVLEFTPKTLVYLNNVINMKTSIRKRLEISVVAAGIALFAAAIAAYRTTNAIREGMGWLPAGDLYGFGAYAVFVETVVPPVIALVLGYWLGRRLIVNEDYSLILGYGGGSMLAVFSAGRILQASGPLTHESGIVHVLAAIQEVSILLLGLFAGAVILHFRTGDQPPISPTEATAEPESAQETESETREFDSQPTR